MLTLLNHVSSQTRDLPQVKTFALIETGQRSTRLSILLCDTQEYIDLSRASVIEKVSSGSTKNCSHRCIRQTPSANWFRPKASLLNTLRYKHKVFNYFFAKKVWRTQ